MYACKYVCMYVCMYACMYVCMYVCVYLACMYICMYVCLKFRLTHPFELTNKFCTFSLEVCFTGLPSTLDATLIVLVYLYQPDFQSITLLHVLGDGGYETHWQFLKDTAKPAECNRHGGFNTKHALSTTSVGR